MKAFKRAFTLFLQCSLLIAITDSNVQVANDCFYYEQAYHLVTYDFDLKTLMNAVDDMILKADALGCKDNDDRCKGNSPADRVRQAISLELGEFAREQKRRIETVIGKTAGLDMRDPRALEFIGNIWHEVTGAPGPHEYRIQLEAEARMNEFLKLQQAMNKNSMKKFQDLYKIMKVEKAQLKITRDHVRDLEARDETLSEVLIFRSEFLVKGRLVETTLNHVDSIIDNGKEGKMSPFLFSRAEMVKIIRNINQKEGLFRPIFSEDEVAKYYGMSLARIAFYDDKLHCFVRIPLVDFSNPLDIRPVQRSRNSPISYLLVNKDESAFRLINDFDLRRTLQKGRIHISGMRKVDVFLSALKCNEIGCEIPAGMPEISQINGNTFTFIVGKVSLATLSCANSTLSRMEVQLPSSGFLRVPESCSFFTKEFKIHKLYETGRAYYHPKDVDFSVKNFEVHTKDETEDKLLRRLDYTERQIRNDFEKGQGETLSKNRDK